MDIFIETMQCLKCSACCKFPGMFLPNEIDKFLEFNSKKDLLLHILDDENKLIFGLEPRKKGTQKNKVATHTYFNSIFKCKFLKNKECLIHDIKPYGCRVLECKRMQENEIIQDFNKLKKEWCKNQKIVYDLFPELKNVKNINDLEVLFNVKDVSVKC